MKSLKRRKIKYIKSNKTRLPLKYYKEFGMELPDPKHRRSPDAGKLLLACQKYLRDTGQEVED